MCYSPFPPKVFRHSRRKVISLIALLFVSLWLSLPTNGQSTGSPNVVISQFYTRGGDTGAAYPNDFVELFNRGTTTVNLAEYSIQITTIDGPVQSTVTVTFVSTSGIPLGPGEYRSVEFPPLPPGPFPVPHSVLGPDGKIALIRNRDPIPIMPCPLGPAQDPDIEDYVGYGNTNCSEGNSPAPTPSLTVAAFRNGGGCADTDNNASDFTLAGPPSPRGFGTRNICATNPTASMFKFSTSFIFSNENVTSIDITVTRTGGDLGIPVTVDYATSDGTASERKDYTTALGTLRFGAGETSKTFTLLLNDDSLPEGGPNSEHFEIDLMNPTGGAVLSDPSTLRIVINDDDLALQPPNIIENTAFFVRQHYHDFLNREPDAAGLKFWSDLIESCGADAQCREVNRINVSAAFFLSIEFQNTGFLVHRLYRASLPETASRPRAQPRFREFLRDTQEISRGVIVGVGNWEQVLESNKQEFVDRFVQRAEFLSRYPLSMSANEYVDALNQNAGQPLTAAQRQMFIDGLNNALETRASVLRKIAENRVFTDRETNQAFVLMQYIGYLRRSPNDTPDSNFDGYDFWLDKLNQFNGNFVQAEMVKAFIVSIEYKNRFGQ